VVAWGDQVVVGRGEEVQGGWLLKLGGGNDVRI
jgi:hypothetical protein